MNNKKVLDIMLNSLEVSANDKKDLVNYLDNLKTSSEKSDELISTIKQEAAELIVLEEESEITAVIGKVNEIINLLKSL